MHGASHYTKVLLILLIIGLFTPLMAQGRDIILSNSPNQLKLQNSSDYGFELSISVDKYHLQSTDSKAGSFDELSIEGYGYSKRIGEAQLPMTSRIVAVPLGAQVTFKILSQEKRILGKQDSGITRSIIPAQPPVSKSADLSSIVFEQDAAFYARNEFNQSPTFRIEEIGMMRGLRLFQLYFEPIRYNPVTGDLEIVSTADIKVEFENPNLAATQDLLARTASIEFDALYAKSIFNYDGGYRTQLVRYPTKMLILCPAAYTSNIQSYVDWKTQQGFEVSVVTVGNSAMVANTTTAIKSYIQNLWNSATTQNPAPTYLLIIGDESGAITVATNTGATGSHVTDMSYVRLNGSDYLPEMYHGRFSVSSTTELANIITKTISYEKTLMPDLSYLGKTVLIAGVDSYWAPTHGNGAINYGVAEYINPAHGIASNNYLYPASGSSSSAILANANEGRGYINYTAHGSQTSWADPSFTVSDVNAMTNAGKYGVMVGNCCITNEFDYSSPCFGEAIIRKANGGGVAYIGGINSTYWDEDYYWAVGHKTSINGTAPAYNASKLGVYDAMFHTHGEASSNWATTTGESIYMGNLAVQQSGSSRTNYYWEIYHIMGDPSLMTYMGVPTVNNASYPGQILIGATQITVTAAPFSRVALTMGGTIYGTGIVPAGGSLSLPITAFTNVGTAKMTITAQDKITLQTDVSIIPNSGPYVSVSNTVYKDNNNNIAEYNEAGRFNVTFQNAGSVSAMNVVTTLSSSTPGISISDDSETIASLAAGASTTVNNAYTFNIANNVPNGTSAAFTITMVSGSETWVYDFTQIINAPALAFDNMTISDPSGNNNGKLDPGETATISIAMNNTGAAASPAGTGTLTCGTSGITILNGNANFTAIAAAGHKTLTFTVSAASSMPQGTSAAFLFHAAAGAYSANTTVNVEVGAPLEVVIGTGTSSTGASTAGPINVYYQSLHGQSVYTAAELNALGVVGPINISQIGFNVTGLPTKAMPNYLIRMGHTTATNVSSWISTGLTTVWTSVSYQPSTTGWNMLTLPTPFLWNGTDNIVIDTAFGVIGSWNSSGTTQYSSSTSGFRYGRSDSSDQTNVFTGGSTSTYRPNVKLALLPNASGPTIAANPSSLSYEDVAVGTSSTEQFTIQNSGNQPLTGTITTPTGYTVALAAARSEELTLRSGKDSRNMLSFIINAGASKTYNLTLTPTAATTYNGNVIITSNAVNNATVNIAVTGAGFIPPTIDIDSDALYSSLQVGNEGVDSFTITNTGSQTLTYDISLAELRGSPGKSTLSTAKGDRSIAGSTLTLSAVEYTPGATQDWTFTVYNGSTDTEWLKHVIVTFPTGVTVNSVTNLVGGSGGDLVADNTSGNGITIDWYGESSNGYGLIQGGQSATATVNVSIAPAFSGTMSLPFQIVGDVWGAEPHTLTGTFSVPQAIPPIEWLSVQPLSGTIPAGQNLLITGYFSAIGMAEGSYEALLTIHSNDPVNPSQEVSASMEVSDNANHAPVINLPASLAFDRNGSLDMSFSPYVSDEDHDYLTLGYSGNSNIFVEINRKTVSFTAAENWTGSETITFSVYDGFIYAYDSVQVTVNELAGPGWIPVIYPNNSATIYGIVSISGVAGQLNDTVGAFVGNECRGIADLVMNGGNAYVTLLVNLASQGENVSFKIYDYGDNMVHDAFQTYALNFAQVLGTSGSPVPISVNEILVLAQPVVKVTRNASGCLLNWKAIKHANLYQIYRSTEPYGDFGSSPIAIVNAPGTFWEDSQILPMAFYKVIAVRN